MATWQFDLWAEPIGWRQTEPIGDSFDSYTFDAESIHRVMRKLTAVFGESRDFYGSILLYGSENGNRADVMMGENGTGELSFRLDASAPDQIFCEAMLESAGELGFNFYSPELGKTIEATASAVEGALSQSIAASFVRDPISVLR